MYFHLEAFQGCIKLGDKTMYMGLDFENYFGAKATDKEATDFLPLPPEHKSSVKQTGQSTGEEIGGTANTTEPTFIRLYKHLMKDYKKEVRPVRNWTNPTIVEIDILVRKILNVDEKYETLKTYLWYRQFWKDEFLTWVPEAFDNVKNISIPTTDIWIPDILINEFVETETSPHIPYVYLDYEGRVRNYKPVQAVTTCSLRIYSFPFDWQNCTFTFTSWLHIIQDINLTVWREPQLEEDNDGEWELCKVYHEYNIFEENCDSFAQLIYRVIIRRRPLFYVVNLLLPSMFLLLMDVIGFYLPPDCGERISFKITLLLGYSVFLIIVSDILPATATGTPLIGVYFAVCLALLVLSLTESIVIVQLVHKQNLQPHVPRWMKRLVLEKLAVLLCIRAKKGIQTQSSELSLQKENSTSTAKVSHYSHEDLKDYEKPQQEGTLVVDHILQEILAIRQQLRRQWEDQSMGNEWLQVGYVLDVLLFRMYLVTLLACGMTLGLLWAFWQQDLHDCTKDPPKNITTYEREW
ncbi:5-hydroxytryptamine receptor 3A-like [Rhinatrema bivittatum]|uniref:5-hydroxytryptamine receptor 3A-like n=1 Tax=Rhinatrema bivittatum TaxID=194408 RepID=UPI001125F54E|nr:5-hydroxytryptamine receptor 3A-like [Rhinatrema bivittatum]